MVANINAGEAYVLGDSSYTTSGTYQANFETIAGCDSIIILVLDVAVSTQMPSIASSIMLYPNPTSGHFWVQYPNDLEVHHIGIYDATGSLIQQILDCRPTNIQGSRGIFIPDSEYPTAIGSQGLFWVTIATNRGVFIRKLVKVK